MCNTCLQLRYCNLVDTHIFRAGSDEKDVASKNLFQTYFQERQSAARTAMIAVQTYNDAYLTDH